MADLARIKSNVAKMASQNAPEADIDGYIASEGVSLDEVRAFKPGAPATTSAPSATPLNSFAHGMADTGTSGFADELGAGLAWAMDKVPGMSGWDVTRGKSYGDVVDVARDEQTQAQEANPGTYLAGQVAGGVGQAAALGPVSMAGRAAQAGGTLGRVAAGSTADGAVLGGLYGAGSGETPEQRAYGAGAGAIAGGTVGYAAPYAVSGATNLVRRAVTPVGIAPERQAAAQALAREGVETTAGQRTGSTKLRYAESEIGGAGAEDLIERPSEQFTAAALKRAGITANRATPDVIDGAFTQIGQQFDRLGARNTLVPDQQMLGDIQTAVREYKDLAANPASAIDGFVRAITATLKQNPNGIPGKTYQSMRSQIDRYARKASDPETAGALRSIKDALDDTMERGLAASGSPDLGEWRAVRGAYRNMLVLEQAATGAGENAAAGIISPSALRNAVVNKQGRRNYARGKGDFDELARAGEMLMKAMPNSGTAGRLRAQNLGAGLLGGAGALTGGVPGMIAGLAAPRVAGALMMSRPGQAYLSNGAMQGNMLPQTLADLSRYLNAPAVAQDGY